MIPMRRVGRPVGVCVMRRDESNPPAVSRDPVKFTDKRHYVGHMLDDVPRNYQIEFVVGKRVGKLAQIVNDIRGRLRIVVQPDRAFVFIGSAAHIKDLCHRK